LRHWIAKVIQGLLFALRRSGIFLAAIRRTGSSCCHNGGRCAAHAIDFAKMSKTKLLRTGCVSQAQKAPKLVFGQGLRSGPCWVGWGSSPSPRIQEWQSTSNRIESDLSSAASPTSKTQNELTTRE